MVRKVMGIWSTCRAMRKARSAAHPMASTIRNSATSKTVNRSLFRPLISPDRKILADWTVERPGTLKTTQKIGRADGGIDTRCHVRQLWVHFRKTNPRFYENDLTNPCRWVRFPKRTHRFPSRSYSRTYAFTSTSINKSVKKRWVRFAETHVFAARLPLAV